MIWVLVLAALSGALGVLTAVMLIVFVGALSNPYAGALRELIASLVSGALFGFTLACTIALAVS